MGIIEMAVSQMEAWANNPAHGYDQTNRWGEKGDYDCSSAVIMAWESAGVPVKKNGATYTGNMYKVFLECGFSDVTKEVTLSDGKGLQRGDVLLNHVKHVAMYCGDGKEVEASINEKGTASGGIPGDQTGKEFLIRPYRNYPWDCILRYSKEVSASSGTPGEKPVSPADGTVQVSSDIEPETVLGAARINKDTKCYLGAGTSYGQAKLFPLFKKDSLVDIMKGSAKDNAGQTWYLAKAAHPTEGFVKEFIAKGTFQYLKE